MQIVELLQYKASGGFLFKDELSSFKRTSIRKVYYEQQVLVKLFCETSVRRPKFSVEKKTFLKLSKD